MKENWTYKKLKHYISEYSVKNRNDEDIPVYSVTNSQGFCREYFSKEVASKDKTTYKIVPRGFFAYNPSRINVGSIDWQDKEDKVIVSPLYIVFEVSKELLQKYLLYYIKSHNTMAQINAAATGSVRANLKLSMLGDFSIPVPPLSEQSRIVSELDLLQSIIDKQQAQLKELDTLAQAVFYDMFGDPVENEKGWEVKRLGDVCSVVKGLVDPNDEPYCNYPHIGGANIQSNTGEFIDVKLAKEENLISGKYLFDETMILYSKIRPNLNKVALPSFKGICSADMYPIITNTKYVNKYFVRFTLTHKHFIEYAISHSGRANIPKINREDLLAYETIVPPLSLQQSFASK